MSGVPESLLTGEMSRVSVEVFNVGQVSLNSLRFTSSLGPQVLLDKVCTYPTGMFHISYSSQSFENSSSSLNVIVQAKVLVEMTGFPMYIERLYNPCAHIL